MIIPNHINLSIPKDRIITTFIFLSLLLVAAFRDGSYFYDYANYENAVNTFSFSWATLLGKEPGFIIIAAISNLSPTPAIFFFFIFAFVSLLVKFYALRHGADHFYYALFALFCIYYLQHELTQIRVSVSAGFFMLAYMYILKGNKKLFYLNCFLAFCFHFSAIILFPLYWVLRRKYSYNVIFLLLPFIGFLLHKLMFLSLVIDFIIENAPVVISTKLRIYNEFVIAGKMEGINLFNPNFLLFLSLYLLFTIPQFSKTMRVQHDNRIVVTWRLLSICIFCYFSFSYITVFSFRTYELLSVAMVLSLHSVSQYYKQKLIIRMFLISILLLFLFLNISTLIVF